MTMSTAKTDTPPAQPFTAERRREHLFYTGMAIAIALTVFAGFARTYYLRPYYVAESLRPLLHLHGVVFTSWVVLLLTQTTLVAAHRVDLHRRFGIAGAVIATLMVIIGTVTAIIRAKEGFTPPGGPPPLVFLVIPLGDMVVFASLVSAGLYFRRRSDVHKRLMVLATISLLAAPIARLPLSILRAGPPAFFGLADLFLLPCILYDLLSHGRIHRATALGAVLIIASQPLRLMLGGTATWLAFATWLTR
jgi:hypothetical protein